MRITADILMQIMPAARRQDAERYASPIQAAMVRFGIETDLQQAMFLAQIGHESGYLSRVVENLNYAADRLCAVWPNRFPSIQAAEAFARQPERIANRVYANRLGNGDEASGDGWRFRGRGLIQITGRTNYRAAAGALELDVERSPDLLTIPEEAAASAAWFWSANKLSRFADRRDIVGCTRAINGGLVGIDDRRALYDRALKAYGEAVT